MMDASPTQFDRERTSGDGAASDRKALTIGAVAKILGREFEDISISKIRYLEDQEAALAAADVGRLSPLQPGRRRATAGDPADAARTSSSLCG